MSSLSHRFRVLASDLDGTLIPLDGHRGNREDLQTLSNELGRRGVSLIYITGRHFESTMETARATGLPEAAIPEPLTAVSIIIMDFHYDN